MKQLAAIALLVGLAACSQSNEGDNADDFANRVNGGAAGSGGTTASAAEVNAQPVVAPSGKAVLTPLAAAAPKTLGTVAHTCQFDYQGRTLLVAGADDRAGAGVRGVLVANGGEMAMPGSPAGAAQVMANGVTLRSAGYTAKVTPGAAAALTLSGPDGQTTFAPGTWSCPK